MNLETLTQIPTASYAAQFILGAIGLVIAGKTLKSLGNSAYGLLDRRVAHKDAKLNYLVRREKLTPTPPPSPGRPKEDKQEAIMRRAMVEAAIRQITNNAQYGMEGTLMPPASYLAQTLGTYQSASTLDPKSPPTAIQVGVIGTPLGGYKPGDVIRWKSNKNHTSINASFVQPGDVGVVQGITADGGLKIKNGNVAFISDVELVARP